MASLAAWMTAAQFLATDLLTFVHRVCGVVTSATADRVAFMFAALQRCLALLEAPEGISVLAIDFRHG